MQADDQEERGRRRRARQMVIAAIVVLVLGSVVGVIGNHEADSEASRERTKLVAAIRGMSFADAALAPDNGQLNRVEAVFGGGLNWDMGAGDPEFTDEVVGWWFWSPRCVVGVVTQTGSTVTVYSGSHCPPGRSTPPTTVPGYAVP
jgi:hypothetical protein